MYVSTCLMNALNINIFIAVKKMLQFHIHTQYYIHESRHTVVCRAAQENGACANVVQEQQSRDFHASVAP